MAPRQLKQKIAQGSIKQEEQVRLIEKAHSCIVNFDRQMTTSDLSRNPWIKFLLKAIADERTHVLASK